MLQKDGGCVGVMLIKGLYKTPAGVFVDRRVLIEFLPFGLVNQTDGRNVFYIDLEPLAGIAHLFVWLRHILRVLRLDCQDSLAPENAIKAGNGAFVPALHELYPEDDKAGVGVSAAHIGDEFQLFRGMLVGMAVGPSGSITKRVPGAVIAFHPMVDILSVNAITDRSLGDAMLLSVTDKR